MITFRITGGSFKSMGYNLSPKYSEVTFNRAAPNSGQFLGNFPIVELKHKFIRLKDKDITRVLIWFEYNNPEEKRAIEEFGEFTLKSLKRYSEYLEQGKDSNDYSKQDLVSISQF